MARLIDTLRRRLGPPPDYAFGRYAPKADAMKQAWERFAMDTLPDLLADPEWMAAAEAAAEARRKRRPALYWMAVRGYSGAEKEKSNG